MAVLICISNLLRFRIAKKKKKKESEEDVESNINSHDPSLSPTSFLSNLSKEKKKKPVLPSPPPLADIADRNPEPESPPEEAKKIKEEKKETKTKVEEAQKSETPPETPPASETPPKPTKSKLIWSGSISMLELSTFKANVYPVSWWYELKVANLLRLVYWWCFVLKKLPVSLVSVTPLWRGLGQHIIYMVSVFQCFWTGFCFLGRIKCCLFQSLPYKNGVFPALVFFTPLYCLVFNPVEMEFWSFEC